MTGVGDAGEVGSSNRMFDTPPLEEPHCTLREP
jgi:hypothetical protein